MIGVGWFVLLQPPDGPPFPEWGFARGLLKRWSIAGSPQSVSALCHSCELPDLVDPCRGLAECGFCGGLPSAPSGPASSCWWLSGVQDGSGVDVCVCVCARARSAALDRFFAFCFTALLWFCCGPHCVCVCVCVWYVMT